MDVRCERRLCVQRGRFSSEKFERDSPGHFREVRVARERVMWVAIGRFSPSHSESQDPFSTLDTHNSRRKGDPRDDGKKVAQILQRYDGLPSKRRMMKCS